MLTGIEGKLAELRRRGLRRQFSLPAGIDFTSNDYLALSRHPALREAAISALQQGPVGAAASRLLRGHCSEHAKLEEFAAGFFGTERSLFFSSGFLANFALFSTLADRHDAVVFDEYVHASVKEGIHASNAARFRACHNDLESFAGAVRKARLKGARRLLLAVESVYSMDGDLAPVEQLSALAREQEAVLVIDEAHATGVFGARGRGCGESLHGDHIISVHTCGKALGVAGALVCASVAIIDYLINRARPFIYSTAPLPMIAETVLRALELLDEEPWRRERVLRLARFAHQAICAVEPFRGSQIIPVIVGEAERTANIAAVVQRAGFDVRAVRPPTVPDGTSRLRISVHADHSEADIERLGAALRMALSE